MSKTKNDSSLHLVIVSKSSEFRKEEEDRVNKAFKELFENNYEEVSRAIDDEQEIEIIYSIQMPVFEEEAANREFYENLEVLLEELRDYSPHFTQFRRVDTNE